jgi:hypothetical protein
MGTIWRGHREVYRDPLMAVAPLVNGDYGVAYSYGTEQADGSVLVRTGQNVGRWGVFRLWPASFLLATSKTANYTSAAVTSWNDTSNVLSNEYVTSCVYFRHIKPPNPATEPFCDHGGSGVSLRRDPAAINATALCLSLAKPAVQAAAAWNFPSAASGRLELEIVLEDGFPGANISLADHFAPAWDQRTHRAALFALPIRKGGVLPDGTILKTQVGARIVFEWDLAHQTAQWSTVSVGGGGELKLIKAQGNEGAASYLWLRAGHGNAGFCVRHIRFVATTHATDHH